MQKHWKHQALALFLVVGIVPAATAALLEEEDLSQAYGDRPTVSIATGSNQPVARAPSVATVLTAADIESMGARDLDDVLAQVPGLHVSRSFGPSNPIYSFRGIHSQYNQQVLMLINGVPMTSVFVGDRGNVWGSMPVDNIARIEVVRGPASALHGADALAGVISIFTKDPAFQPGTSARVDTGSFNTYSASLRHAGRISDVSLAAYLRMGRTTGNDATIAADAQTALDQAFATQASRAPGPMNSTMREVDAALDLKYAGFQFRTAYKKRGDVGTGSGIAEALDPQGRNSSELLTADLGWSNPKLTQNLGLSVQAQFADRHEYSNLTLYPPGAFNGAFPDGMIGRPEKWERRNALSTYATYNWKNHRTRLGLGYVDQEIYRTREEKNYDFLYVMGVGFVPVPLGGIQDVSGTAPFLRPQGRILRYVYLQDEWQISPDLALTGGLRQDSYSDFGRTTNPRLALVWETSFSITSKLLYGRAFRPPSFAESYNINNPVATGNSALKPETIETVEAAISWQIAPRIHVGFNVFHYEMEHILRFVPNSDPTTGNTAQNAGRQVGTGFELEGSWDVSPRLKLAGNYTQQYAKDPDSGRRAANVPRNRAYVRTDWQFSPGWWLGPQMTYIGQRSREASDSRGPLKGYTLVDVALRNTGLIPGSTLTISVRNLADADAFEPSPAPGRIPNDFPLAGRSIFMNLTHSF